MTDSAFWDRIAPRYATRPVSDPDAYEETLTRVRTHLKDDARVLELGAGTGSTALKLVDSVGQYVASDISPGMIAIATEKLDTVTGKTPIFRVGGVSAADYPDDRFDTVLAFNLLHLLPDLEHTLQDIKAMLPPGGLFISKTPALAEKWYFGPMIRVMRLIGKAPFVRTLGVDQIDQMIADAGFQIVETGLYPPKVPSRFVVARKI